ncbi:MAG TPA: cysteine rich repeat-containing protein [Candidatus Dormibacteraeota bacterium]|nr:cysteine rich repeat-containing protein [Candidatus Dormibacteraeota bacterium]
MRLAGGVLLATLLWAAVAGAQGPDAACAFDVQKLCSDVNPGGGRVIACLHEHESALSPGCKEALSKKAPGAGAKPAPGGWFKSCEADVAKLCKDVPAGKGRVAQCLSSHSDQLSPTCKAALESRPQHPAAAPAATVAATAPAATVAAATPKATAKKKK